MAGGGRLEGGEEAGGKKKAKGNTDIKKTVIKGGKKNKQDILMRSFISRLPKVSPLLKH